MRCEEVTQATIRKSNAKHLLDIMKSMTGLSTTRKALVTQRGQQTVCNKTNVFSRFDKGNNADHVNNLDSAVPVQSIRIYVTVGQVRKNTGPDNLSAFILKAFAAELAPVWQEMWKTLHMLNVILRSLHISKIVAQKMQL